MPVLEAPVFQKARQTIQMAQADGHLVVHLRVVENHLRLVVRERALRERERECKREQSARLEYPAQVQYKTVSEHSTVQTTERRDYERETYARENHALREANALNARLGVENPDAGEGEALLFASQRTQIRAEQLGHHVDTLHVQMYEHSYTRISTPIPTVSILKYLTAAQYMCIPFPAKVRRLFEQNA